MVHADRGARCPRSGGAQSGQRGLDLKSQGQCTSMSTDSSALGMRSAGAGHAWEAGECEAFSSFQGRHGRSLRLCGSACAVCGAGRAWEARRARRGGRGLDFHCVGRRQRRLVQALVSLPSFMTSVCLGGARVSVAADCLTAHPHRKLYLPKCMRSCHTLYTQCSRMFYCGATRCAPLRSPASVITMCACTGTKTMLCAAPSRARACTVFETGMCSSMLLQISDLRPVRLCMEGG